MATHKSTHNLRIHLSFPDMGTAQPSSQGSQYNPPVDTMNYKVASNLQSPKDSYGPTDTPQYG